MSPFHEFEDSPDGWGMIRAFHDWDMLIHGGTSALATEHRCRRVPAELANLPSASISRHQAGKSDYFVVDMGHGQQDVHFSDLSKALDGVLTLHSQHVVLDITSIEVDVLLLLMPLLARCGMKTFTALFVSPAGYGERGPRISQWSKPRQPPGYVTLRSAVVDELSIEHCVLLGFDAGRVNRIISAYDWDLCQVHALLGDPPYFQDGDTRACEANRDWLDDKPRPCLHRVPAADPFAIKAFLQRRLQSGAVLDILPFGPKPMVLGALLFYFSLPETDRERVRFLYDFPEYHQDHTTGVGRCFRYDLTGFAN
jgi:hypothetical protein